MESFDDKEVLLIKFSLKHLPNFLRTSPPNLLERDFTLLDHLIFRVLTFEVIELTAFSKE